MNALSMWQPWASLWLTIKENETRPWLTHYRGWLGVHATKRKPDAPGVVPPLLEHICEKQFGLNWRSLLPRGMLIGAVNVVDCKPVEQSQPSSQEFLLGDYTSGKGRHIINRSDTLKLPNPIPMLGAQRFFRLSDDVAREIEDLIKAKMAA